MLRGRSVTALRLLLLLPPLGLALFITTGAAWAVRRAPSKSRTHTIPIRSFKFLPASLIVNVGDTVVWKNDDIAPHTATARGKRFDSGSIEPGASWSYLALQKGTYPYYCAYHPGMKGKLVVR